MGYVFILIIMTIFPFSFLSIPFLFLQRTNIAQETREQASLTSLKHQNRHVMVLP